MSDETRQLATRTVYSNPWMTVREDDICFPDGHQGIYGVVDKPDYALIVPIHADGRIQMVQQYRYPVGARFWEFPQGTAQGRPDIDPEELARAELEEETGFRAGQLDRLTRLFQAYGYSSQAFNAFLARDLAPGTMKRDVEEQGMITAAFSLDEIVDMIGAGEIRDASTVAVLGYLRLTGVL